MDDLNEVIEIREKEMFEVVKDCQRLTAEKEQAVKDTAKEIYQELEDKGYFEYGQFTISGNDFIEIFKKRGVEVE